jgi:hypothetical protein
VLRQLPAAGDELSGFHDPAQLLNRFTVNRFLPDAHFEAVVFGRIVGEGQIPISITFSPPSSKPLMSDFCSAGELSRPSRPTEMVLTPRSFT